MSGDAVRSTIRECHLSDVICIPRSAEYGPTCWWRRCRLFPADDRTTSMLAHQMLVRRLLKTRPLTGRYALTICRAHGGQEILCAFEKAVDAQHAARGFDALVEPRVGWTNEYAGSGEPRRLRKVQPRE